MTRPILYVNGDSHAAAAEAANPCAFAEDDPEFAHLGRGPHPANARVSWAQQLAEQINYDLVLDAESASSNARIIRTTSDWIKTNQDLWPKTLVVIQWSTWEREEWIDSQGDYYQVNASGVDQVPKEFQDRYKHFVANVDWLTKTQHAHDQIHAFHLDLKEKNIDHVFFNGNNDFSKIATRVNWHGSYMDPYSPDLTYNAILRKTGFKPVAQHSWHFGKNAHCFWADIMLQYLHHHNLVSDHELRTD